VFERLEEIVLLLCCKDSFTQSKHYSHFSAVCLSTAIHPLSLQLKPGIKRLLVTKNEGLPQGHQFQSPENALDAYVKELAVVL